MELEDDERTAPALGNAHGTVIKLEREHGQALFGFVRRHGLADTEAQDAVQDVLLRLWRELRRGAPIANPLAWAYRSVYRLAMDQHRVRRRMAALTALTERRAASQHADDADVRIAVWAEVDRLPVRQRQVLYLRFRSDLSFETIAAVLGISASAARSHAAQGMATLRRRLAAEVEE